MIKQLAEEYLLSRAIKEIIRTEKRKGQNHLGNHVTGEFKRMLKPADFKTRCRISFWTVDFPYDIYLDEFAGRYYFIGRDSLILYIGMYTDTEEDIIKDCMKHNAFIQSIMAGIKKTSGLGQLLAMYSGDIKASMLEVQPYRNDYLNSMVYKLICTISKKKQWIEGHMRRTA